MTLVSRAAQGEYVSMLSALDPMPRNEVEFGSLTSELIQNLTLSETQGQRDCGLKREVM